MMYIRMVLVSRMTNPVNESRGRGWGVGKWGSCYSIPHTLEKSILFFSILAVPLQHTAIKRPLIPGLALIPPALGH